MRKKITLFFLLLTLFISVFVFSVFAETYVFEYVLEYRDTSTYGATYEGKVIVYPLDGKLTYTNESGNAVATTNYVELSYNAGTDKFDSASFNLEVPDLPDAVYYYYFNVSDIQIAEGGYTVFMYIIAGGDYHDNTKGIVTMDKAYLFYIYYDGTVEIRNITNPDNNLLNANNNVQGSKWLNFTVDRQGSLDIEVKYDEISNKMEKVWIWQNGVLKLNLTLDEANANIIAFAGKWKTRVYKPTVYTNFQDFTIEENNETATNETAVAGNAQLGIYVRKVTYDWGTGRQRVNGFSNTKVKFLFSNGTLITEKITDNAGFTGYVNISAPVTVKVRAYYEENKYEERSYKLQPNDRRTDTFMFLFTSEGIKRGNILVVKAVDQNNNPLEDVYIKVYEYVADPINPHDGDLYAEGPTNSYGKFATSVAPGHVHIYADYNGTQKDQIINVENDLTVIFTFNTETGTVTTRTEQYADTTGTQFENSTVGQDLPLPNASEWWARNKDKVKLIAIIAGLFFGIIIVLWLVFMGIASVRKAARKAFRAVVPLPVLPVFLSSEQTKYLAIGIGAGLFIALLLLLMFRRVIIATRVFVIEDREPD
ncbi:MAG: hypothetical protein J7K23_01010 [Thermoproteales archaeon]|nr:hypothetical protein [Thermoproteales archaeon]